VAGVFTFAAALVLGSAVAAQAKPSASEVRAQIAAQNKVLEPIIEQYNGLRAKLAADKAKAKTLEGKLGPVQLQAAVAQGQLGEIASTLYQTGPISSAQALLSVNSTTDMLDVLGSLNELAHQQASQINNASKIVVSYQTQQKTLADLIAKENQQYSALVKQKATIQTKVDALQKLLDEVGGGGGTGSSGGGSGGHYTKAELMPKSCPVVDTTGKGHTAAVKACSLVWDTSHSPPWRMYGWADAGPDKYDCSGLTMTAWKAAGVSLTHYTGGQWNETRNLTSSESPAPGDLVFYYKSHSHVALYVGGGWIVQAEQTGEPLKMSRVNFDSPYYYRRVK
jgi:cell wall-associated NlpC family hydrolase